MSPQGVKELVAVIGNNGENSCPKMLGEKLTLVEVFHREAEQIPDLRPRQTPLSTIATFPSPGFLPDLCIW